MKIINIGVRLCLEGTGKAGAGLGVFLMVRRERPSLNVGCLASDLEALLQCSSTAAARCLGLAFAELLGAVSPTLGFE